MFRCYIGDVFVGVMWGVLFVYLSCVIVYDSEVEGEKVYDMLLLVIY